MEKLPFHISDNNKLHNAKEEILMEMKRFEIVIDCCGFFELDRRFLSRVRMVSLSWTLLVMLHSLYDLFVLLFYSPGNGHGVYVHHHFHPIRFGNIVDHIVDILKSSINDFIYPNGTKYTYLLRHSVVLN